MNTFKTTTLGLLTLATATQSCQKDYYLQDLEDANAQIDMLTKSNSILNQELTAVETQLKNASLRLDNITILLNEANKLTTLLESNVEELNILLDSKNIEINTLTENLNIELARNETNVELIATLENDIDTLNEEIDSLETAIETADDRITELSNDLEYLKENPTIVEVVRVVTQNVVSYVVEEVIVENEVIVYEEVEVEVINNVVEVVEVIVEVEVPAECDLGIDVVKDATHYHFTYNTCNQDIEWDSMTIELIKVTSGNKKVMSLKHKWITEGEVATVKIMHNGVAISTYFVQL